MGDYTPTQKLYKVGPGEIVNVDLNLNYNWRKLDTSLKQLVDWYPTDSSSIIGDENTAKGHKFLKRRSNSTWFSDSNQVLRQDLHAYVNTWNLSPPDSGWEALPDATFGRLMYYVDADGDTYLRGTLQRVGALEIVAKTLYTIATLPVGVRPVVSRYFFQHQGLADSSGYSVNRFFIGSNGLVQVVRYGNTQGNSAERYITLSGISFPRDA